MTPEDVIREQANGLLAGDVTETGPLLDALASLTTRLEQAEGALREIDALPLDADITDAHNISARVISAGEPTKGDT